MATTLHSPSVRTVLDRLFAAAANDDEQPPPPISGSSTSATARQRADALQTFYLPISARGGELLYTLVRASRPTTVVEFGTSFGISTVYLAAAIADNGAGRVFGTELNPAKVTAVRANLDEAGLGDRVTILAGDALDTLADIPGPIGVVLLDGWKDQCLPVLRLLEPRLESGALVVADDIELPAMADYLDYVRDPANGYVSVTFPVEDGMEISCRSAAEGPATVEGEAIPDPRGVFSPGQRTGRSRAGG
ncbi:O-methyltransferase [Phytohabitans rumicis]|uniref:Putative O-methyltransferase, family 3 n=1 Tax=Phytohabitans rumicis TaxID=1076125 RepID=A0A6V8LNR1_9ACTN|nr:class I SAM-dependent methyltransferase [Phytohabitans rumicis]GFJ95846.1 putative O-methyltransferase, family 3 [Phytohabitans rumicis]